MNVTENLPGSVAVVGCGWLGLPLARKLSEAGYKVFGTTTSPEKLQPLSDVGIEASLFRAGTDSAEKLPQADLMILNIPPSGIAGYAAVMSDMADVIRQRGSRVFFCSTTSVYPEMPGSVFESDLIPGVTPVVHAELARHGTPKSELVGAEEAFFKSGNTVILRLAGLIGGGRHPVNFLSGRTFNGDALAPVNLIHRDDIITIIHELIARSTEGEIFNICAEEHPSKKDYYTEQAGIRNIPAPVFSNEGDGGGKIVDSSKIRDYLNIRIPLRGDE